MVGTMATNISLELEQKIVGSYEAKTINTRGFLVHKEKGPKNILRREGLVAQNIP